MQLHGIVARLLLAQTFCSFAYAESNLSVYEINPWVDGTITGVAALGAALPLIFEDELIKKSEFLRREDVNRFDRSNIQFHSKQAGLASHLVVATALIAPVYFDAKDVGLNATYVEDMVVYTQVLAVNSTINNIARFSVQRARPDAYRKVQPASEAQDFESFLSGHTASIFAGLTTMSWTVTWRYGPRAWPWLVTAGAGITQGALRSLSGRHFYSDVLLGIGSGTLVGTVIPWLHHRNKKEVSWLLYPSVKEDEATLVWMKRF